MSFVIRKKTSKRWLTIAFLFSLSFVLLIDLPAVDIPFLFSVDSAIAFVGRPATPRSVAGVHRRTRRRTARRISGGTRIYVLPAGCTTVIENNITYYYCDGIYYRPYYEGDTVVYVEENP